MNIRKLTEVYLFMKKFNIYLFCILAVFVLIPATVLFTVSASGIDRRLKISSSTQTDIGNVVLNENGINDSLKNAGIQFLSENEYGQQNSGRFMIDVYFADLDETRLMDIEEYTKGVVRGEMLLSFESEALKAQAVAARTYTLYKLLNGGKEDSYHKDGAAVCTDYTHCQAWKDPMSVFDSYPDEQAKEYYEKLTNAVESTEGVVMTYEGKIIQAYYFSNGGGYTEDIENVWDSDAIEYLQGVPSVGDITSESYCTIETFSPNEFINCLQTIYPELDVSEDDVYSSISNIEKSETGRVTSMNIGGVTFRGTELRSALGLRSTNFILRQIDSGEIIVVVFGSGHGVGMSQWGAGVMASGGSKYDEILKHYYRGVEVKQYDLAAIYDVRTNTFYGIS